MQTASKLELVEPAQCADPLPRAMVRATLSDLLVHDDLPSEQFWAGLSQDWRVAFEPARAPALEAARLPYDKTVLTHLQQLRAQGHRLALISDQSDALNHDIAQHLGLFDLVQGAADAPLDTPMIELCDTLPDVTDPGTAPLGAYIKALRPHQYAKNVLIFLPMIAAHQLDGVTFLISLMAFVAFCLIASSVYVLNDLLDLAADRAHPRKCRRPFASGAIPLSHGAPMLGVLLAGGGILAGLVSPLFAGVMLLYFALTLAYSFALKRKVIVDICVLAGLYTLRIIAGGAATGIPLSVWLLAFSMFLFFSLASVKRQAELVDMVARNLSDASGRGYRVEDLPIVTGMAMASGYLSVLVMMLYINSPAVLALYSTPAALLGICCMLLFWITRMIMVTHRGCMHDDPIVYAARDRTSQLCLVICVACALGGSLV